MCNGRKARIQVKRSLNFKGCHGHARGDPRFTSQYFVFDFGITARGQSGCWCQKHPFIKITVLNFGKTMSGVPGKLLTFFLKR